MQSLATICTLFVRFLKVVLTRTPEVSEGSLYCAVMLRRIAIVPVLLEHRVNASIVVEDRGAALDMAVRRDNTESLLSLSCKG